MQCDGGGGGAALAVLRGDALVTAHYRLGIGVNAAFRTLRHLEGLLRGARAAHPPSGGRAALRDEAAASSLLREYVAAMDDSAADQANRQLATIYFEAICGFLLFADGYAYRRRRSDRSLQEVEIDTLMRINCTAEETFASRSEGIR